MKMKRILSLALVACIPAVMAACSGGASSSSSSSSAASSSSSEAASSSSEAASSSSSSSIVVMAAASLKDVTAELSKSFATSNPNIKVEYSYGASGTLQTQIEQGAPADVFISAATAQMQALEKKGLVLTETDKNLLTNKLVLITPASSKLSITSFNDLSKSEVKLVGIGDPKSVPAGQYAKTVLTSLKLWDAVSKKTNYGTDVRQVLSWVESGNVEAGLVYATDAATSAKVKVVAEAPAGSGKKIIYPAAVLKSSKSVDAAKAYLTFLHSDTAAAIFKKYGFGIAS